MSRRPIDVILVLSLAVSLLVGAGGCINPVKPRQPARSNNIAFPHMSSATLVKPPIEDMEAPATPRLTTPELAVRSYLDWVTYAYLVADSDVATKTFSPQEEVRVNSYIEYNRQASKRVSQHLVSFSPGARVLVGRKMLLPAHEEWQYSYLDLGSTRSRSPTYTVSYDATYTLIPRSGGTFLVDSVEAKALGELK